MSRKTLAAVVAAKDAHIRTLEREIAFLRRLVQPSRDATPSQIEADAVLEGRQDQIPLDERKRELDSEAARLLSGNY